jgi:hypothetical protein
MFQGTDYPQFRRTYGGNIAEKGFFRWADNHMYRTSYNDMKRRVKFRTSLSFSLFRNLFRKRQGVFQNIKDMFQV